MGILGPKQASFGIWGRGSNPLIDNGIKDKTEPVIIGDGDSLSHSN